MSRATRDAGLLLGAMLLVLAFLIAGCDSPTEPPVEEPPVLTVVVDTTVIPVGMAGSFKKFPFSNCEIREVFLQPSSLTIVEACEVMP